MLQMRVRDVMTPDVVVLPDTAATADVAATLTERGISGVPIVNRYDVVIGVVTWTDILRSIDFGGRERGPEDRHPAWRRTDRTAVDVMSPAPATIDPDASLAAAGRTMHRRNLSRLLVVDRRRRMLGIVTRRDVFKPFSRLDGVIEDDVKQQVLRNILMVQPGTVQVRVEDGVATLTGHTARESTARAAAALAAAVPGVAGVVDALSYESDNTVPAFRPTARATT